MCYLADSEKSKSSFYRCIMSFRVFSSLLIIVQVHVNKDTGKGSEGAEKLQAFSYSSSALYIPPQCQLDGLTSSLNTIICSSCYTSLAPSHSVPKSLYNL